MLYQQPSAPTLPPQPMPSPNPSQRRPFLLALVVIVTLGVIAGVVSTVPAALTKARTAAYPKPALGEITISSSSSGGSTVRVNAPVQFSVSVLAGRDLSYHWDFGDGNTSTDAQPTYVYSQYNPNTQVTVEVTDPIGQTASQSSDLAVLPAPPVITSINLSSSYYGYYYCNYVDATVNVSSDVSLSFQWNWGDGSNDSTGYPEDTHSYNANGTYTITVTAIDTYNQTATSSQNVTINC